MCVVFFAPMVANAAEPITTTDPFQKTTVPGFSDNVDLYDESTWADLEPEEKDKLRAVKARIRNKTAPIETLPKLPASDKELPPIFLQSRTNKNQKQNWWYNRHQNLKNATIGFGITWGLSTAATAIIWSMHSKNNKKCIDSSQNIHDDQKLGRCVNGAKQSLNLIVPGYITSSIVGASMLGTIISGALLGAHVNSKPFISANRNSISIGLSGRLPSLKL